jgi:hypothetical protein
VADVIAAMQAPAETLTVIYDAIPYPTVALAPAAAMLCERIISLLPADTAPGVRAFWLSNLGLLVLGAGPPGRGTCRPPRTRRRRGRPSGW